MELDNLQFNFDGKVDAVMKYRAGQLAAADGIRHEITRLEIRALAHEGRAESLKNYVLRTMQKLGVRRIDTGLFPCRIQKNSRPAIRVRAINDVLGEIPADYRRTETKVVFDGAKAYEDWKAGRPLPPEIEVIQGEHLRIA
jgi:hypothetical protein